jgi:hypothetical protein
MLHPEVQGVAIAFELAKSVGRGFATLYFIGEAVVNGLSPKLRIGIRTGCRLCLVG